LYGKALATQRDCEIALHYLDMDRLQAALDAASDINLSSDDTQEVLVLYMQSTVAG
jgi:hypothetical protein